MGGWVLSDRAAAQLKRMLDKGPMHPEPQRSRGGTHGRHPVLVRCTSATPVGGDDIGDQAYPAVVVGANALEDVQPELGGVWLTVLGNGGAAEVPAEDALYHGLLSGDYDPDPGGPGTDERPRVFAVADGASSGTAGACGGGCGTLAGLFGDESLSFAVTCATGEFSAFNQAQTTGGVALSAAQMRPTGTGVWTLQYWNGTAWTNFTFNWTGGTGTVVFTWNGTLLPTLTIGGTSVTLLCLSADATFVGGRRNGLTGGGTPAEDCAPNDIGFRIGCDCEWPNKWQGPGIYCADQGDGCEPLTLTQDDVCDPGLVICSGPYANLAAAEAVCGPVVTDCCPGGVPATLYFHLSNCSNPAHPLNNQTYAATYQTIDSVAGWWVQTGIGGGGCVCSEAEYEWFLWCDGSDVWQVETRDGYCGISETGPTATCSPFSMSFTADVNTCAAGATIDVVVNATP